MRPNINTLRGEWLCVHRLAYVGCFVVAVHSNRGSAFVGESSPAFRNQRTNNVLSVLYGGGVCTPLLITLVHIMSKLECRSVELTRSKIVLMFITASVFYIFFQLFFILFCNRLIYKQL